MAYFLTVWAWIGAGCARGDPPPASPTHEHFAEIQQQEARLAEAQAMARREMASDTPDCARACDARKDARRAADALCRVARGVDDTDAQTRCGRARASLREMATRVEAGCACQEAPPQ